MRHSVHRINRHIYGASMLESLGFIVFLSAMAYLFFWNTSRSDEILEIVFSWVVIVFHVFMILFCFLRLSPALYRIELDETGLFVATVFRRKFYPWENVTKFDEFRHMKGRWPYRYQQVEALFSLNPKKFEKKSTVNQSIVLSQFQTPPDFVNLLNQFRERRIRQIAPTDPLVDVADISMTRPHTELNLWKLVATLVIISVIAFGLIAYQLLHALTSN